MCPGLDVSAQSFQQQDGPQVLGTSKVHLQGCFCLSGSCGRAQARAVGSRVGFVRLMQSSPCELVTDY